MPPQDANPEPIPIHPRPHPQVQPSPNTPLPKPNPLPPLLQTPSGLALVELQGTINLPPFPPDNVPSASPSSSHAKTIPIGRVHFEDYQEGGDDGWMKRVWMYVGENQRLAGEVRKLPRAVAVLRRRGSGGRAGEGGDRGGDGEGEAEQLEVVEVVKWKVVFSSRPEPVGSGEQ